MWNALGSLISGGMGLLLGKQQDRRQFAQQEKLQRQQIQGAKELGKYSQELGMKTWKDTNYEAQRRELQKAGLNVGLMYEGGGQGGTTSGGNISMPTGAVAAGHSGEVGMAMQLGIQKAVSEAGIKLAEAQAKKAEAEAAKIAGVDTAQGQATIDKLKADTENQLIQTQIGVYEKELKRIEAEIANKTQDEVFRQIKTANDKLEQEYRSAAAAANVDEATQQSKIQQIKTASIEQGLRIAAQKQGLIKGDADINAVNQGIAEVVQKMGLDKEENARKWQAMSQQQVETWIKQELLQNEKAKTNFNTSTPAQIRQWTEIIGGLLSAAKVIH